MYQCKKKAYTLRARNEETQPNQQIENRHIRRYTKSQEKPSHSENRHGRETERRTGKRKCLVSRVDRKGIGWWVYR
jgi:hypothetical protein